MAASFAVIGLAGGAKAAVAAEHRAEERASVILGNGQLGTYGWRSEVRAAGKLRENESQALCVNTLILERTEGSEFENCGPVLSSGLVEISRGGTRAQPITILTTVFMGPMKNVYLKRSGHPGQTFALRRIGVAKLHSISPSPLSTFAHAFSGMFCLERYAAYDVSGSDVADSGHRRCG